MSDERPLLSPTIAALPLYRPGRSVEEVARGCGLAEVLKLASNENPLGPSPRAVEAAVAALRSAHRYPDGAATELKAALAERCGVSPEQLVLGAGSTDLIELCVRTFATPQEHAVISAGSFIAYRLFLLSAGIPFTETPLAGMAIDLEAMAAAVRPETKLVFIPNPNNPTGSRFGAAALTRFLGQLGSQVVLVLDDAYLDFNEGPDVPDTLGVLRARGRTVVLRSFSKVYGLAGLRLGFAVSSLPLAQALQRVHRPFAVSRVAVDAGRAALLDEEHLQRTVTLTAAGRRQLTDALQELGLEVLPSHANFVTMNLGAERVVDALSESLLRQGLIVRPLAAFGLPAHLRVSVGTERENGVVVDAIARQVREDRRQLNTR